MSRLFDKYLISMINQRIPMPKNWQTSLGLKLENHKQSQLDSQTSIGRIGYKFQQDDTIDRGFINSRLLHNQLTKNDYYQIALYLEALKDYSQKDFTPYFAASYSIKEDNKWKTTIPVVAGEAYSIICKTSMPVYWRYYSEVSEGDFGKGSFGSITEYETILTADYDTSTKEKENEQEYFMLEVISYSKAVIVRGAYNSITATRGSAEKPFKHSTSLGVRYSDKLIPSLLDIQLTEESSPELRELISSKLPGNEPVEDKIKKNTKGIYDVDEFIGRNLEW